MSNAVEHDVEAILRGLAAAAPELAAQNLEERAAMLEAVAAAVDGAREELVPLADRESHLGPTRLGGELTRTTFQLRMFAGVVREGEFLDVRLDRPEPDWPSGPRPDLRRYRIPVGPVEVFAASNFPFAFSVAGGDTASALAAGCPVAVKAHPGHPELSRRTAAIVARAIGVDGAFALVESEDDGVAVLRHPALAAAGFTGSIPGGLALARIAAEREVPIPFYGELGSVNPQVVTAAAAAGHGEQIARDYVASLTMGAGQFCTNPGLLFVPRNSELPSQIAAAVAGIDPAPMLNARIADAFAAAAERLRGRDGVEVLRWNDDSVGARVVVTDVAVLRDDPAVADEVFGPLGLLVRYDDIDEVIVALATLPGQLTAGIQGTEAEATSLAALTNALVQRAGRVLWNQWPTGVAVSAAQQHGGPFPATTTPWTTSVGTAAIERFLRPVSYQNWPDSALPAPLRDENPWGVPQSIGAVDRFR